MWEVLGEDQAYVGGLGSGSEPTWQSCEGSGRKVAREEAGKGSQAVGPPEEPEDLGVSADAWAPRGKVFESTATPSAIFTRKNLENSPARFIGEAGVGSSVVTATTTATNNNSSKDKSRTNNSDNNSSNNNSDNNDNDNIAAARTDNEFENSHLVRCAALHSA